MVVSKYLHYYFVPMWPVAKEANVIMQPVWTKALRNRIRAKTH